MGVLPEKEAIRQRYVKTHGNFAPGEMFTREYNWPEEAKEEHFRFGVKQTSGDDRSGNGGRMALAWDLDDDGNYPKTRFIQRTSEDYRSVVHPKLARKRNYQQGKAPVSPNHVYGIKSMSSEVRAFGTPCVRADIPSLPPEKRSLADGQNYADEVGSQSLLNPQRFDSQGVPDRE